MSNVTPFERGSSAESEASEWLVRLDGDATPEDHAAFERWLAGPPERRVAYDRLQRSWQRADELAQLRRDGPPDPDITERWLRRQPVRARGAFALAAATALAATLVWAVIPSAAPLTFATEVGARRTVTLADGSLVELNTGTGLEVDFSDDARRLRLTHGEAFFQVAHDRSRPFIVTAGGTAVRAVGTAFNVRRRDADVEVTVTEGRVEVAAGLLDRLMPSAPTALIAGKQAAITRGEAEVATLGREALARDLAWRQGMLAFADEPLQVVVEELARYSDTRIRFADDELRSRRVGGYFRADDLDTVLDTMARTFRMRVERTDDGTVILHKAG